MPQVGMIKMLCLIARFETLTTDITVFAAGCPWLKNEIS